jgi:hypothetical protein
MIWLLSAVAMVSLLLMISKKEDTMLHSLQLSFHLGAEVASKIKLPGQGSSGRSDSGQGHTAFFTIE